MNIVELLNATFCDAASATTIIIVLFVFADYDQKSYLQILRCKVNGVKSKVPYLIMVFSLSRMTKNN